MATPRFFFDMTQPSALQSGQTFDIAVKLNTNQTEINAVQGNIVLPPGIHFESVQDGNSLVNFWVEAPHLENGMVRFAGIIPGGLVTADGTVFTLRLTAQQAGHATLDFKDLQLLANDGNGSVLASTSSSTVLTISASSGTTTLPMEPVDTIPPELFVPIIAQDPNAFDGKFFLTFATQDKISGVDHYEVKEGSGGWQRATSPYVLHDQTQASELEVKAIDRAGNERLVEVIHGKTGFTYAYTWLFGFGILCVLIGVVVIARRKRR